MAKRAQFTAPEARSYLELAKERGLFPGRIPKSDDRVKRVAREVAKRAREARTNVYETRVTHEVYTERWVGPAPIADKIPGDMPTQECPQVTDLILAIKRYTKTPLIMVGIWGWLRRYIVDEEKEPGLTRVYVPVQRDQILFILGRMRGGHKNYDDPEYTELAHLLLTGDPHFTPDGQRIWEWTEIYQWRFRDIETEENGDGEL